jgi:hypothetical protein
MAVEILMRRFVVCLVVGSAYVAAAGNPVNPDACELVPLPAPVSFSSDMDAPVDFSSAAEVVVEVPDPAAVGWLNRRFADWYGKHAPRAVSGKTGLALLPGDEAYAVVGLGESGDNAHVIIKEAGSAGTADPLNQVSTVGWKVDGMAALVLNPDWLVCIEAGVAI